MPPPSVKIRDILKRHPVGSMVEVWVAIRGGLCYMGRFGVERRTLRHIWSGITWHQLVAEFRAVNHYRPKIAKIRRVGQ